MIKHLFVGLSAASLLMSNAVAVPVPDFVSGSVTRTHYDGITNDLLTGGLGKSGLQGAAPGYADAENPTSAELRTNSIYANYRGVLDMSTAGGYGTLWGPNLLADGTVTAGEGLVAGVEIIAFEDEGDGAKNVTMMVQIPDSFDPDNPCIITGPSSGSGGIYSAIGSSGEWGLVHGCAVAYTDGGRGTGVHNLSTNTVTLIDGLPVDASIAGTNSVFTADLTAAELDAFNSATPNRVAYKHAHSKQNPEVKWGKNVLSSIKFAFYAINQELENTGYTGPQITKYNTIVIASSVSNGGNASLRAVEQDSQGLIDGAAVSEPGINIGEPGNFSIVQGSQAPFTNHSKVLYDYFSLSNIYQSCAIFAPENAGSPFHFTPQAIGEARCLSLYEKGLLSSPTFIGQSTEAQQIMQDAGFLVEQNPLQAVSQWTLISDAIAVTYANAYSKTGVEDNLCGYSLGATTHSHQAPNLADPDAGLPTALSDAAAAVLFASASGIAPSGGISIIYNDSLNGPREARHSVSPSSGRQDNSLDGAICLRNLYEGKDIVTGVPLSGSMSDTSHALLAGINQIKVSGKVGGIPTIAVAGRADSILPANHSSRAYFGFNRLKEGANSAFIYYEVKNAHHLDTLNQFPYFNSHYVPIYYYWKQAMDIMYNHLKNGAALPASQVIHALPRTPDSEGNVPPINVSANLPAILLTPGVNEITFTNNQVIIPE